VRDGKGVTPDEFFLLPVGGTRRLPKREIKAR
jgi:hypothetical protein